MLEPIRGVNTARKMLDSIYCVFQLHTLLNKLRAHRDFYTVEMRTGERIQASINRVQHSGSVLMPMGVDIESPELAMATINGLPGQYENIITALEALGDDRSTFYRNIEKSITTRRAAEEYAMIKHTPNWSTALRKCRMVSLGAVSVSEEDTLWIDVGTNLLHWSPSTSQT